SLLVADHPYLLEIDAERRQIFRDIADVLVLGAAGQDLAADHQERGRDNPFGNGRVGGWHDHLRVSAELLASALFRAPLHPSRIDQSRSLPGGGMEENFQPPESRPRRRSSFAKRPKFFVGGFA